MKLSVTSYGEFRCFKLHTQDKIGYYVPSNECIIKTADNLHSSGIVNKMSLTHNTLKSKVNIQRYSRPVFSPPYCILP